MTIILLKILFLFTKNSTKKYPRRFHGADTDKNEKVNVAVVVTEIYTIPFTTVHSILLHTHTGTTTSHQERPSFHPRTPFSFVS